MSIEKEMKTDISKTYIRMFKVAWKYTEGSREKGERGTGGMGRGDPNNVYTYE
jgi:hypothetical protein